MKKLTKTDFERLVSDGTVKIKLTAAQQVRYEQAVKTQRRVNMGMFYRAAFPKEFLIEYQRFTEKAKKNNNARSLKVKPERKKRGRPPLPQEKKKSESIEGLVTPVDKYRVMYAAQRAGVSESQFVAEAVLREAARTLYEQHHR